MTPEQKVASLKAMRRVIAGASKKQEETASRIFNEFTDAVYTRMEPEEACDCIQLACIDYLLGIYESELD